MTHAQSMAYRFRWFLLIVGILCLVPAILWIVWPGLQWFGVESVGLMGTPATWGAYLAECAGVANGTTGGIIAGLFFLGLFLLAEWMFLRPRRGWTIELSRTGRPMTASVITAAFMAMLLSTAFAATLLEIPGWWTKLTAVGSSDDAYETRMHWIWGAMAVLWVIWAAIFFVYWRQGDRYTQLGRMIRGLIAGSVLELIVVVPVQLWSPQRKDCYCAAGSYTGLVFGGTVLLWAFGPGIILLFLHEQQRREHLLGDRKTPG